MRQIEEVHKHEGFIEKNFWKLLALGVLLTLAIPAQGLGSSEFKGPSILILMAAEYWQVALIISVLYTIFCTIGHFGWKLQDYLYLKELYDKRDRLLRELGVLSETTHKMNTIIPKEMDANLNRLEQSDGLQNS